MSARPIRIGDRVRHRETGVVGRVVAVVGDGSWVWLDQGDYGAAPSDLDVIAVDSGPASPRLRARRLPWPRRARFVGGCLDGKTRIVMVRVEAATGHLYYQHPHTSDFYVCRCGRYVRVA